MEITDFDAFLPETVKKAIKINGESYGIYDMFDLSRTELNLLFSFEDRSASLPDDEQYAELKRHIMRLVPKMQEATLDAMSLRRLGALFAFVKRAATPEAADPLPNHPSE